MFGKGGGPLNAWIKEFCELVFIQTLQAFIFALVMGFIINILNTQIAMDQSDRNASLGIICIVVLTSIFKIEDIARRIFGYGPTKADHGNAVQSIGKSMMALKMGKNLLDNGKKIVGGAGAAIGAHSKKVKAQKRMEARQNALDKDNMGGEESTTTRTIATADTAEGGDGTSMMIDTTKGPIHKEAKDSTATNASNVSQKSAKSSNTGRIKDYNQKKLQIQEEYKDKMAEINKQKRQGIKQMVSGVAESGAALVGFTAGTAMSAASTNDWGGAFKDGITWAGTADAVTAGAVDLGAAGVEFLGNRARNAGALVDEYAKNVKSAYDDLTKNIQSEDKKITQDAEQQMQNIKNSAEKAVANAAKASSKKSSSSNKNVKLTALKNGLKKTAGSHSVILHQKVIDDNWKRLDKMNATGKATETDRGVLK